MTELEQLNEEFINLIKHLFERGTSAFIIIFGRRETGKTDLSLLIAEILFITGIIQHFASNIKIYKSPMPIEHITNLDDLRLWSKNTPGKKLFLFDEFGKAMRRRSPMSSLNIKLIDDLQILRKYKLSDLCCTVDEKYVDNSALGSDVLDGIFVKTNYKNPKVALYNDFLEDFSKAIEDIPRTSIEFDTWDVAPFTEHSLKAKPLFKDSDMAMLWDLTHGKTIKDLGVHPEIVARTWRKFVKEVLERDLHPSQPLERAALGQEKEVTKP